MRKFSLFGAVFYDHKVAQAKHEKKATTSFQRPVIFPEH